MSFWQTLPTPFFALAPMEGATDTVFRRIVARASAPDIFFTEFVSTDSYCSPLGQQSTASRLKFTDEEQPLVAQIWGTRPEHFAEMANGLKDRGYAGIDINMGCPVRDVVKRGACSALIETPSLAGEIIAATKTAGLPVSVKTRIGFRRPDVERWLSFLLEQDLAALTIHARTAKEMSKVPAHWEAIAQAVALRDAIAPHTRLIGNGDVANRAEGLARVRATGADGIMIGRGVFTNVFCFERETRDHPPAEYLNLLREHLDLFDATWPAGTHSFQPLKRFFKVYVRGFDGAGELREQLMRMTSTAEARTALNAHRR